MAQKKVKKQPKVKKPKKDGEKTKTTQSKTTQKKTKEKDIDDSEIGIVVIEEDLKIDKKTELEERKAYLEESRSQETSD